MVSLSAACRVPASSSPDMRRRKKSSWIGIGFGTSDLSGLILIITLILTGIALRRSRRGGGLGKLAKVGGALPLLLMVLYLVAIWAMTTKPS